jgi:hypothetical protein
METTWKTHPDFSRYEVSDDGRVRVAATGRELAQRERGNGGQGSQEPALRVDLRQDGRRRTPEISTLVLETFVRDRAPLEYATHLNGDVLDNSLGNLRWTPFEDFRKAGAA